VEAEIHRVLAEIRREKQGMYRQNWVRYAAFHLECNGDQDIFMERFYTVDLQGVDRPKAIALLKKKKSSLVRLSSYQDYSGAFIHCEEIILKLLTDLVAVLSRED